MTVTVEVNTSRTECGFFVWWPVITLSGGSPGESWPVVEQDELEKYALELDDLHELSTELTEFSDIDRKWADVALCFLVTTGGSKESRKFTSRSRDRVVSGDGGGGRSSSSSSSMLGSGVVFGKIAGSDFIVAIGRTEPFVWFILDDVRAGGTGGGELGSDTELLLVVMEDIDEELTEDFLKLCRK